jgi:hypothetical protein
MLRLVLAAILLGGLALGLADQALALNYEEPVVPAEFRLSAPPAPPVAAPLVGADIRLRLVREGADGQAPVESMFQGSGVQWARVGAPGAGRWLRNSQWGGGSPCALWTWNVC